MTQQPETIDTCASYTVQPGDSLSLIAMKAYGDATKWQWIYDWPTNKQIIGDNPDLIQPEQNLYIPHSDPIIPGTSYTVQVGDTLQSISEYAYCDTKYWQSIWVNNENILGPVGFYPDAIQLNPGQLLFIPADVPGHGGGGGHI
jgi:nucleoid-associated protein YgaU